MSELSDLGAYLSLQKQIAKIVRASEAHQKRMATQRRKRRAAAISKAMDAGDMKKVQRIFSKVARGA